MEIDTSESCGVAAAAASVGHLQQRESVKQAKRAELRAKELLGRKEPGLDARPSTRIVVRNNESIVADGDGGGGSGGGGNRSGGTRGEVPLLVGRGRRAPAH